MRFRFFSRLDRSPFWCASALALSFALGSSTPAQTTAPSQATSAKKAGAAQTPVPPQKTPQSNPQFSFSDELKKYPGLGDELVHLLQKLEQNVDYPAPRSESKLLPLLPEATVAYVAFPNYGNVAHQTLATFQQELQESAVLRDWWAHGRFATSGPEMAKFLDRFDQLHEFLGGEIVLSGSLDASHKSGSFLALAEIRKPGLDKFVQQWLEQAAARSNPGVRVLSEAQLAAPQDSKPGATKDLLVLVRPDLVIAGTDLEQLRGMNARLKSGTSQFAASAFGQRVAREYLGGLSIVAAADLQMILNQDPLDVK
jgi:hypothetical protein